jgi:hypothetical protein
VSASGRGDRAGDSLRKADGMTRNVFSRGVVAFALTVILGVPGIAAAESTSTVLTVSGIGAALWDFFTGGLLEEEAATSSSGGSDSGGDTGNGGGAMDPNGGGTGGTPISPKP